MNNIVKIVLISLTFVAMLLLGFFIMSLFSHVKEGDDNKIIISKVINTDDDYKSDIIVGNKNRRLKLHVDEEAETVGNEKSDDHEYDNIESVNPVEQAENDQSAEDEKPELRIKQREPDDRSVRLPAKQDSSTTPEIKSAIVGLRSSANYRQAGYDFTASASTESGDNLLYELFEADNDRTAKYQSQNGQFKNVYPVDTGKYWLRVTNTRTGDFATKEVSGFGKINKYSAVELQNQLNSDTQEKLFYHHFDHDKLKFDCEGADASDGIGALLEKREAFGWVLTVVGTPQYDEYNRITYFKVKAD